MGKFNLASSISNFLKRDNDKAFTKVVGDKVNRGAGYGLSRIEKRLFLGGGFCIKAVVLSIRAKDFVAVGRLSAFWRVHYWRFNCNEVGKNMYLIIDCSTLRGKYACAHTIASHTQALTRDRYCTSFMDVKQRSTYTQCEQNGELELAWSW